MADYALTGHPLGHSMSPLIHNRLFELSGITDARYSLVDIAPEDIPNSRALIEKICGNECHYPP